MAKKKKFKLTGQLKAQLLSQSAKTTESPTREHTPVSSGEPNQHNDQSSIVKKTTSPVDSHVISDIKHIGVVVGVLTILLIVVAIVNSRMQLSLTVGQKITQALGI